MDDDLLDAGCEPGSGMRDVFRDDQTDWLVLFASVLYSGPAAIAAHAAQWQALGRDP